MLHGVPGGWVCAAGGEVSDWQRYGDTPDAACERLSTQLADRIRQVDALYEENKALCAAMIVLVTFDSRAYVKQSTLARDLLAARQSAKKVLARNGHEITEADQTS